MHAAYMQSLVVVVTIYGGDGRFTLPAWVSGLEALQLLNAEPLN
jgi:hypothetical protein